MHHAESTSRCLKLCRPLKGGLIKIGNSIKNQYCNNFKKWHTLTTEGFKGYKKNFSHLKAFSGAQNYIIYFRGLHRDWVTEQSFTGIIKFLIWKKLWFCYWEKCADVMHCFFKYRITFKGKYITFLLLIYFSFVRVQMNMDRIFFKWKKVCCYTQVLNILGCIFC